MIPIYCTTADLTQVRPMQLRPSAAHQSRIWTTYIEPGLTGKLLALASLVSYKTFVVVGCLLPQMNASVLRCHHLNVRGDGNPPDVVIGHSACIAHSQGLHLKLHQLNSLGVTDDYRLNGAASDVAQPAVPLSSRIRGCTLTGINIVYRPSLLGSKSTEPMVHFFLAVDLD